MDTNEIIDALGGTGEVARLCQISPASVSEWRAKGEIPKARLMFLRLACPNVFEAKPKAAAGADVKVTLGQIKPRSAAKNVRKKRET